MIRSILVTGAAGFIGSHLTELLIQKGYKVIGLDNLSYGVLQNLSIILGHSQFEFIQGDVRNFELMLELGKRVDAIIHLAAFKIPRYGNALETFISISQPRMQKFVISEHRRELCKF